MRIKKGEKNFTKNFSKKKYQKEIKKFTKEGNFLDRELKIINGLFDGLHKAADDWYQLEEEKNEYDPYSFFAVVLDLIHTQAAFENKDSKTKELPDDFYIKTLRIFGTVADGKNPYWKSKDRSECNG